MKRDNHPSIGSPAGRPPRRNHRKFQRQFMAARRLAIAIEWAWIRRYQFEQELILRDQEPRFRVSWKSLKEVAEDPRPLLRGFPRFIHRLHRFARSESDEAVRAYHAISRTQPPDQTSTHQPSPGALP